MTIWDYHIDYGRRIFGGKQQAEQLEQQLITLGKEEWELVTILPVELDEGKQDWLIFKRPVPIGKPKA